MPNVGLAKGSFCKRRAVVGFIAATVLGANAIGASFGPQVVVQNIKVSSIFRGGYGPTYVTFTPSTLTGCNGNYGGYLSATWPDAIVGWPADSGAGGQQLSLLMLAKATDALLEVRFRVNLNGTGWDKCAIDSVWVQ
jgi:hypothetical protein